jgi:hypothetical protein
VTQVALWQSGKSDVKEVTQFQVQRVTGANFDTPTGFVQGVTLDRALPFPIQSSYDGGDIPTPEVSDGAYRFLLTGQTSSGKECFATSTYFFVRNEDGFPDNDPQCKGIRTLS